jgi:DNA polymerase
VSDRAERREALKAVLGQARACARCPELAATRTTVVFGSGNADADLMFVGEAPGANEDKQGLPFVGQAGKLLDTLLAEIGLARSDVFVVNTLKCRPPGNRDPLPGEIENCRPYLLRQVELIEPLVICTLGNFATKLLRDDPAGITRVHGQVEVRTIGSRTVRIYPIYHPAAALYTPRMLETLREDFARLPALLALPAPEPAPVVPEPEPEPEPERELEPAAAGEPDQLGLF